MDNSHLAWWITRSTAIVAWALVTASIVWGLALSSRLVRGRGTGPWLLDLHRWLGALSLVFTAAHVGTLLVDSYVGFGVADLLIPFRSPWRPHALAWGIVGFYLLVLIQVTSWTKRRIPKRLWHAVHLTSIPLFITSCVHAALAGADRNNRLLQWLLLTAIVLVVFTLVYRIASSGTPPEPRRRPAPAARPTTAAGIGMQAIRPAPLALPVGTAAAAPVGRTRAGAVGGAVGLRREPLELDDGSWAPVHRQAGGVDELTIEVPFVDIAPRRPEPERSTAALRDAGRVDDAAATTIVPVIVPLDDPGAVAAEPPTAAVATAPPPPPARAAVEAPAEPVSGGGLSAEQLARLERLRKRRG